MSNIIFFLFLENSKFLNAFKVKLFFLHITFDKLGLNIISIKILIVKEIKMIRSIIL